MFSLIDLPLPIFVSDFQHHNYNDRQTDRQSANMNLIALDLRLLGINYNMNICTHDAEKQTNVYAVKT